MFKPLEKVIVDACETKESLSESAFLSQTFNVNVALLGLESSMEDIIEARLLETESCINNNTPLSSVIMIGSVLESVLLGTASSYPKLFNQTKCSPKDDNGRVRMFQDWTLNSFIYAAYEIGFIIIDVKKFSHVVRDFRNYIHPYSQRTTSFYPDNNTALICFQVLKAAISQIGEFRKSL